MELVLFEPNFTNTAGHYNRYVRVLAREAARQGFSLTVATSSAILPGMRSILEGYGARVLPVFEDVPWQLTADPVVRDQISRQVTQVALSCLGNRTDTRPAWLSGNTTLLAAASQFATEWKRPFVLQMLDFAVEWPPGELTAPAHLRAAVAEAVACGMSIRAQSPLIARHLQDEIGVPVGLLPAILDLHPLKRRPRRPRPVIGIVNMFRNAKNGSAALHGLMAHGDKITLVLHTGQGTTVDSVNALGARVDALAQLYRLKQRQVRIVAGMLPSKEYLAMWQDFDCTVMPYDPARYQRQGSGVLFESLADAIIPIAPLGTSMAATMTEVDVGLTYDADAQGALQGSVGSLLQNFDDLVERQRAFAPRYREANAPARVVAALLMEDRR